MVVNDKTVVVTTTIRLPKMLEDCCKIAEIYNNKNIEFVVVGDKNIDNGLRHYCESLSENYNFPVHFMDIEFQKKFYKEYPLLLDIVPYNDACRKQLGVIYGYIKKFDKIIMLDDDNFPVEHDFFKYHNIVGTNEHRIKVVSSDDGWYNSCNVLIEKNNIPFYYRGFPYSKRNKDSFVKKYDKTVRVAVNSGFWLNDPDVDAITRLFYPVECMGMDNKIGTVFGLEKGTWCPFNNQNTCIARRIVPAYFTPASAYRFSDLFPAYVICRIAEHLDDTICYGYPFVNQNRNHHNLWNDLLLEFDGCQAVEILIDMLRNTIVTSDTYHSCLEDIINGYDDGMVKKLDKNSQRNMLKTFFENLSIYHNQMVRIRGDYGFRD